MISHIVKSIMLNSLKNSNVVGRLPLTGPNISPFRMCHRPSVQNPQQHRLICPQPPRPICPQQPSRCHPPPKTTTCPPQPEPLRRKLLRCLWFLSKVGLFVGVVKFTIDEGLWGTGEETEDLARRMGLISDKGGSSNNTKEH